MKHGERVADAVAGRGRTIVPTALLRLCSHRGRVGRLARLAVHVITEAQYTAGVRELGRYAVRVERGDCVTTYRALARMLDSKPETASRMIAELADCLGWKIATLTTADADENGGYQGGYTGGHQGRYIGVRITICDYDRLQDFGGHTGGYTARHRGGYTGGYIPSPSPSQDPLPDHPVDRACGKVENQGRPEPLDLETMRDRYREACRNGMQLAAVTTLRHLAANGNEDAQRVLAEEVG